MATFIYVGRLGFATLVLALALVALPLSMAWSAEPVLSNQLCPVLWAT